MRTALQVKQIRTGFSYEALGCGPASSYEVNNVSTETLSPKLLESFSKLHFLEPKFLLSACFVRSSRT